MQFLGNVVRDADLKFGLGSKAQGLVLRAVDVLFDVEQGGIRGLRERLERAGLAGDLENWLDPQQEIRLPETDWVDQVIGSAEVSRIGKELGLANARVRSVFAFVLPSLIRSFSSSGGLPEERPQYLIQNPSLPQLTPSSRPLGPSVRQRAARRSRNGSGFRWFWTLGSLLLLLTGYYLGKEVLIEMQLKSLSSAQGMKTEELAPPIPSEPSVALESRNQGVSPDPRPFSRLVVRSFGDRMEFVGFLDSEDSRRLVSEKLGKFFGSSMASGDLLVDTARQPSPWLQQLDRLLPLFNVPGIDVRLDGNTVRVGGWLTDEDRAGILNSLMSILGSEYRFGYLRDEWTERSQDARQLLLARLGEVTPDFRVQDVVPVLNQWVVHFDEGSSNFPQESRDLADRVVEVLKSLKQTAVMEVQVRVASGPSAQRLATERANVLREALIKAGWPATLLKAKGAVDVKPPHSGDGAYQAARSERIEFRVIQVCDPLFPCEISVPPKRSQPPPEPTADEEDFSPKAQDEKKERPQAKESGSAGGSAPPQGASSEAVERVPEDGEVTRLKSLEMEVPRVPVRPRPKTTPKPAPVPTKETEWYDPLGLF